MTQFIEPCCVDRQLPALLRENQSHAVLFQTAGDVTFDHLLKAVSSMAGNNHLTMTLVVPEVTAKMQKTIDRYQQRKWITEVKLLVSDIQDQMVMFEGDKGVVIIQGTILDTRAENGSLLLYAGQYATDIQKAPLAEVIASRLRLKAKAAEKKEKEEKPKENNDDVEPTEQVEAAPQAEEGTEATA